MANSEIIELIKQAFELESKKQYKKAIEMLYKGLAIEQDNVDLLLQIASINFKMGHYDTAKDYIYKVFLIDRNLEYAVNLLIEICIKTNDINAFKQTINSVDFDKVSAETLNIVAKGFVHFNLYDEFIKLYKNIDETKIADSETFYYFALCNYLAKDYKSSQYYIQKSLDINPKNVDSILLSISILYRHKEYDKMLKILSDMDEEISNPHFFYLYGLAYLETEKYQSAVEYFNKAIALNQSNPDYYYNLATTYYILGWLPEALKEITKAKTINPSNIDYTYLAAEINYSLKKFDIAMIHIDAILEIEPDNFSVQILKNKILIDNYQYELARKNLLELSGKYSKNPLILKLLYTVYFNLKLYNKAIEVAEELLNFQKSAYYSYCLANIYYILGNKQKALDILLNLSETDLLNKNVLELIIKIYYDEKNVYKTKNYISKLIQLVPDSDFAYYMSAKLEVENNPNDALSDVKTAISLNPEISEYYSFAGNILAKMDDYSNAYYYYKEAFQISENLENAFALLDIAFKTDDIKLIEQTFKLIRKIAPYDLNLNFTYVDFIAQRDIKKAIDVLCKLEKGLKDKTLKAVVKSKIREMKSIK